MDLPGLLSDFSSCCGADADPSERDTFFATLAHNQELQSAIFAGINSAVDKGASSKSSSSSAAGSTSGGSSGEESAALSKVLSLLLHWSRHVRQNVVAGSSATERKPHLILQFVPSVLALTLTLRRTRGADRRRIQELEAFLMALHNQEAAVAANTVTTVAVPGAATATANAVSQQVFSVQPLAQSSGMSYKAQSQNKLLVYKELSFQCTMTATR